MKLRINVHWPIILATALIHFKGKTQRFTEISDKVGINYVYPGNDYQEVGAGVTVFDVNNDGWDDIFQAGGIFPSKLWLNEKGKFRDVSKEFGLEIIDTMYVQAAGAADFNNDGFEDLFIANMAIPAHRGDNDPPVLLMNMEGKGFTPVMQNIFNDKGHYPGCSWGDINSDGYVDLYLINYVEDMANGKDSIGLGNSYIPSCLPNKMYLNRQGVSFDEITDKNNLGNAGCGLASCFTDFDNDNDVDLILLNDFGSWNHIGNRIFENDHGSFIDITDSLNFYTEFYGMGVGPGDINNDGYLDYYLTNIGRNYFFENTPTGFKEQGKILHIDIENVTENLMGTSWSGIFLDVENDGDQDLFIAKGHLETIEEITVKDENQLFLNDGNGRFDNISKTSGINDSLMHRGAATLDYDHDGDLDIVCGVIKDNRSEFAGIDQKIKLFENNSDIRNNWIGFKLVGQDSINTSCVGCSVSITHESFGTQIKEVDGGSGHSSQSTKTLYFGLGELKYIDDIRIQWIGGNETIVKKLKAGKVYQVSSSGDVKKYY